MQVKNPTPEQRRNFRHTLSGDCDGFGIVLWLIIAFAIAALVTTYVVLDHAQKAGVWR